MRAFYGTAGNLVPRRGCLRRNAHASRGHKNAALRYKRGGCGLWKATTTGSQTALYILTRLTVLLCAVADPTRTLFMRGVQALRKCIRLRSQLQPSSSSKVVGDCFHGAYPFRRNPLAGERPKCISKQNALLIRCWASVTCLGSS
eukprot:7835558-Pyramimonas_sp.AAC.1